MTTLATHPMPKKSAKTPPEDEFCEYVSTRLDRDVMPRAIAAAAMSGKKSAQEFISDVVNEAAAKVLGVPPVHRKPPPPKPKGRKSGSS